MRLLTDVALISLGFLCGILLVAGTIVASRKRGTMVVLFPSDLRHYDVILGGVGNRGRLLWKNPKFKHPGEPEDVNLDEWR